MKSKVTFLVLMLALFATVTLVHAGDPDPGDAAVNFTVMNMDSAGDAVVTAQYVNTSGVVDVSKTVTIPPLSSSGFPINESGLPDGWNGSGIISADREIAAFAQIRWKGGANGDGLTAGAYNGFAAGANTLYFPSLKARSGSQFSSLSIQSADTPSSSETVTFGIEFYNRDGTSAGSLPNQVVKKGAQVSYDLLVDVSLPANWNGSAVVTSASPIAGAATTHWPTYSTAYSGITGGNTTAYIPEARRRLKNGAWDQYTGIVAQNLDASAASITVKWYDRSGNLLHQFNDTIPANSSNGYNTRFGADIPDYGAFSAAVGDTWNGSVIIESTNGKNVVAVVNLQWADTSAIGGAATSFVSEGVGAERILIPASFRRGTGAVWNQFTGLIVQNIGGSSCANFDVEWFDRDGNNLLGYTDSLGPGISHGYNTRYGADVPATASVTSLGDDFRGSVVIEGPGCELIAIHNTVWPIQSDSTSYQGIQSIIPVP